jgi:hypothetical protein
MQRGTVAATVFLYATEAGRPLYAKLGFRVVDTVTAYAGRYRREGGPLVADSMTTAKALLDAVLPGGTATVRVDLHSDAAGALGCWLAERGLTARPPSPLMVRGQDLPGNRAMQLSPLMQALG